MGKKAKEMQP